MTTSPKQILTDNKHCPSTHSFKNKLGRVAWGIVYILCFVPSPRPFHFWRRMILRSFGATIGPGAKIDPTVSIWAPWNLHMGEQATLGHHVDCYCVATITIGSHATVSQYAFLCSATHDVSSTTMQLVYSPITIEDQAWVCANAFIGPGITLHQGAVAGACSVVTKDIPAWKIAVGNPAKVIKDRVLS